MNWVTVQLGLQEIPTFLITLREKQANNKQLVLAESLELLLMG